MRIGFFLPQYERAPTSPNAVTGSPGAPKPSARTASGSATGC